MFFILSPELMITQQTTQFKLCTKDYMGFPGGLDGKESACNAGDPGSIPGSGRFLGEGNGNPLQYSCLKIPWREEPTGLQSMESQTVRHDRVTNTFRYILFQRVVPGC